jgi:phosphohistidine phosphatase SixA
MTTLLCLLRHGRASGQGSDAALLPEGEAEMSALGRRLAWEGMRPAAAFCSPYRRARDTANLVLGELGSSLEPVILRKLQPESRPADALDELFGHGLPDGPVFVVSHLPLVAHLAFGFTGETVNFEPGTYAEIELDDEQLGGVLRRVLEPGETEG